MEQEEAPLDNAWSDDSDDNEDDEEAAEDKAFRQQVHVSCALPFPVGLNPCIAAGSAGPLPVCTSFYVFERDSGSCSARRI